MNEYEAGYVAGVSDYKPIPPLKDPSVTDATLEQIIDSRITYANPIWLWLCSRWRIAELFDQATHWCRPAYNSSDGIAPWQWVQDAPPDPDSDDFLPQPTLNEGYPIRANESSRLARPRYRPEVRPSVDNPDTLQRQATRKFTRAQHAELERMRFSTEDDMGHYRSPLHGQQIFKSWWEQRHDEIVQVPTEGAKECPNGDCDFRTASGMVPAALANPVLEKSGAPPLPSDASDAAVENCFQCEDKPPLQPLRLDLQEAATAPQDSFGRPLTKTEPKGNWRIDCLSPYDVFLPNCGVGLRWDNIPEFVHCHVETLDWVALHFPDKASLVQPENAAKLMQYHPIGGAPTIYGGGPGAALFKDSVRVKELVKKPWMEKELDAQGKPTGKMKLNKGRYIVMAGGIRLLETDLMMESLTKPGEMVERVWLEMPPWDLRDGGHIAYGMSLWDQMISAAEQVDEIAGMRAAVRIRCAVPLFWAPNDSNFGFVNKSVGVPGVLVSSDLIPGMGEHAIPKIISNTTIDEGVNKEEERYVTYMNNVGGRSDVEKGDVPGNVSAATAINILKEESNTVRSQRIERIKASRKRLFAHGAKLMAAMWIEPRAFKYDSNGQERWDSATGFDFSGLTNVEIEPEPEFDSEDQKRESVRDYITISKQPVDIATPLGRKLGRLIGLPAELLSDDDVQELQSDREWRDFIHGTKNPIMDPSLDDPGAHYEDHGKRCSEEEFTLLEEKSNWDGALAILSDNWDQDLQLATQPMTAGVPMMTGQVDPMTMQPQMIAVPYMQAAQMGLVQPVMPQSMEQRIATAWLQKLQMFGFVSPDEISLKRVMVWRAHIEAHRLYGEMKQQAAMMKAVMASPGAEDTQAGTEVTQNTPPSTVQPMPMQ